MWGGTPVRLSSSGRFKVRAMAWTTIEGHAGGTMRTGSERHRVKKDMVNMSCLPVKRG